MEPEIQNIIELIGNWDPGYTRKDYEYSLKVQKNIRKIIKQYTIHDDILDMYKYCKLCHDLKKYDLDYVYLFTKYIEGDVVDKHMMEYYKNKHYDLSQVDKAWMINDDYELYLFGYHLDEFDKINIENLNYIQVKYILNLYHNTINEYHVNSIKFILECKRLGYSKDKAIKKIKWLSSMRYDMITPEYYRFMCHKQIDIDEFLAMEKFNKIADACIDYVYALYNTTCDLDCDEITISRDSINQLITSVEQFKK